MTTKNRGLRYALACVCAGLLVVIVLVRVAQTAEVTSQIRESQVTNTKTLDQSREVLHAIRDCTEPSGDCYRRAQAQTAGAVSSINNVVILAAACASGLPPRLTIVERQTRIQSCVITRLAQHKPH